MTQSKGRRIEEEIADLFCKTCVISTSYCEKGKRKNGFMCNQVIDFVKDNKKSIGQYLHKEILSLNREVSNKPSDNYGSYCNVRLDDIREVFNRFEEVKE